MAHSDTQSSTPFTSETINKLISLGCNVREPKTYTRDELAVMENKQGVYLLTDGDKHYYLNNKLHRTDGPAIERTDGYNAYYLNGELYKIAGLDLMLNPRRNLFYPDDKMHRLGPVLERVDGNNEWYLNPKFRLPEQEHTSEVATTDATDA